MFYRSLVIAKETEKVKRRKNEQKVEDKMNRNKAECKVNVATNENRHTEEMESSHRFVVNQQVILRFIPERISLHILFMMHRVSVLSD